MRNADLESGLIRLTMVLLEIRFKRLAVSDLTEITP